MDYKSKKGFTLVEIMIVVIIIGLLAALAVPAFQRVRERALEANALNSLRQFVAGGQQYMIENSLGSANWTNIVPTYVSTFPSVHTTQLTSKTVDGSTGSHTISMTYGGTSPAVLTY